MLGGLRRIMRELCGHGCAVTRCPCFFTWHVGPDRFIARVDPAAGVETYSIEPIGPLRKGNT